jgi:hypothetical protein
VAAIGSDPVAFAPLAHALPSVTSVLGQGLLPTDFLSNLLTGKAGSLFLSMASQRDAIWKFFNVATGTSPNTKTLTSPTTASVATTTATKSTSTSKARAAETGKAVGYAAAAGAGFLGVVMAL